MLKKNFFNLALSIVGACSIEAFASEKNYIIDGNVGGDDIDGPLALLQLIDKDDLPLAITTSHSYPKERAKIAKLILEEIGLNKIPAFSGIGCDKNDKRETFLEQNSLWPAFFGHLNPKENEKEWYPKSGEAYRTNYSDEFDKMLINTNDESAIDMIVEAASKRSKEDKLDIVALGPLHNIAAALEKDKSIGEKIRLWSMGGDYPFGYNWLISPETSSFVLKQVETKVISSQFIRENNFDVTEEEFHIFEKSQHATKVGKTILKDWFNWNKGDALKNKKNLCNPVTLMIYLMQDEIAEEQPIQVTFPCLNEEGKLKEEFSGKAYCQKGMEGKFISLKTVEKSHVSFIKMVKDSEKLRRKVIYNASKVFYPGISEDVFFNAVYDKKQSKEEAVEELNKNLKKKN